MDEADKEYKKMFERISESREAMKVFPQSQTLADFFLCLSVVQQVWLMIPFQASYAEFMADAQASATRGMLL